MKVTKGHVCSLTLNLNKIFFIAKEAAKLEFSREKNHRSTISLSYLISSCDDDTELIYGMVCTCKEKDFCNFFQYFDDFM